MNLKNYFWYFDSVLSENFCKKVIDYGNSKNDVVAGIGGISTEEAFSSNSKKKKLLKTRNSSISWLTDWWIQREIMPYVFEANKNAGWNFNFEISEKMQFTKYGLNQHYGWHQDAFMEPFKNQEDPRLNNKIRKISVTCQLSDGEEYEGGNLFFDARNKDRGKDVRNIIECTKARKRGTIVVFPSFVWHKVAPVTKGTRYSLVIWSCGEMYK